MKSQAATAIALAIAACRPAPEDVANGPDPLRALAQHVESSRYGPDYWKQMAQQNGPVWHKALAYCQVREATEYPTCASVKMVAFLEANARPAVEPAPFTYRTDQAPDTVHAKPQR